MNAGIGADAGGRGGGGGGRRRGYSHGGGGGGNGGEDWDLEWGRSGVEIKEVEVKWRNKMVFELDGNEERGKFGEAFW